MRKLTWGCSVAATALWVVPAHATFVPVPTPESGLGLAAMAALGAGYYFLKKRIGKN